MSLQKINIRNSVLILMIIGAAATRLLNINHLSVWSNFTPVGAVAMFGGAYFSDKWKAYLVPLLTLFISDVVLNSIYNHAFTLLYDGFLIVYIAFAIMVLIGSLLKNVT